MNAAETSKADAASEAETSKAAAVTSSSEKAAEPAHQAAVKSDLKEVVEVRQSAAEQACSVLSL